jgi:Tfp pilus assembly protein PilO
MRGALTRRDRAALLAGVVVIGGLLGYVRGVPSWRAWEETARGSALELRAELASARASAGDLAAAIDSLEARRDRFVALAPALLDGDTPAAAGAALASRLAGAAAKSGVRLGAVQVRPDTAARGTFTRVRARVDAVGDVPAVARFVADLESGPELLAIRELSVNQPDAGGPAERPETLRMEITVEGMALIRPRGEGETPDGAAASAAPREGR